jgi:hypothetical protein
VVASCTGPSNVTSSITILADACPLLIPLGFSQEAAGGQHESSFEDDWASTFGVQTHKHDRRSRTGR